MPAVQAIEVIDARVAIHRRPDGSFNLPATIGDDDASALSFAGPFSVGRLVIDDLAATYSDELRGVGVEIALFSLALESRPGSPSTAAGRFSADGGVRVRAGERVTTISRLDGGLAFDGARLTMDDVVAEAPEGSVRARGYVDMVKAQPTIDVAFEGDASLEDAIRWVAAGEPPQGRIHFSGRAFGARSDPTITLQASGDGLAWHDIEGVSFRLSGAGGFSRMTVDGVVLQAAEGGVEGRGSARIDEHGAFEGGEIALQWRNLDAALLTKALALDSAPRLSARLDGVLTATLSGSDLAALTADLQLDSRRGSAAGAPVSGHATLRIADGGWTLTHDHRLGSIRIAGSNRGALDAGDFRASTVRGDVSVAAGDLARAARDLGAAGIAMPAAIAAGLQGRLAARAALEGTIRSPVARVQVDASDVTAWTAGPASVTARGTLTPDEGRLTAVEVTVGPNRAWGVAAVRWQDGTLGGTFAVDAPAVERLAARVPAEWRPAGGLAIAATLGGTTDEPRLSGTVEGGPLAIAGQTLERVTASFRTSGTAVAIEDARLTQAEGWASAAIRYDLATGRYAARAEFDDWEVVPAVPEGDRAADFPVEGRFSGRFDGEGTLDAPAGDLEVTFTGLRYGAYPIGSGRLDVAVAEERGSITGSFPDLLASVGGSVELAAPYPFLGTFAIDRADLSRLAGAAPGDVTAPRTLAAALNGALSLSAEISGTLEEPGESVADLQVDLVDASIGGMPMTLKRAARFRYRREDFGADAVELRVGESSITLDGRMGQQAPGQELRVSVDARLDDVIAIARLVAPDLGLDGHGSMAVQLAAHGPLTAPQVTARTSTRADALAYRDLPAVTDLVIDATYDEGLVRFSRANAAWQSASVTATAEIPAALLADYLPSSYLQTLPPVAAPARLSARIESAGHEVLAPFLEASTLSGIEAQVSGRLEVQAARFDPASIQGWFELDRADFVVARVPVRQLEPTRLTWNGGNLNVERFRWGAEGNQLVLTGGVALGAGPAAFDLDMQGVLDLRMLSAFVPDMATDGTAQVQLTARGTSVAPDVRGQIVLSNVGVTVRQPRLAITGLSGTIHATGDRLTASGISGSANGGTVTLGGNVAYPGLAFAEGLITVDARQVAMALTSGGQAELDADLTLVLGASVDPQLEGRVTLLRGAYRDPISLADLAFGRNTAGIPAGLTEETVLDRIRLNVAVVTDEDFRIDNNYGRADVGASLRVLGTVGQPGLGGRATIREGGQVFLGGHTYVVEQSTVDFSDPTRIEPELNLRARTRIGSYGITFGISGTLDRLEHDLQSDPPLSESDIVSVLVTGRTLSEAGSAQTEVARDQVLAYLSGDFLGFAGRAVGLDAVRLERGVSADTMATDLAVFAGDEDPASRLTISKYLRRDVEIVLSQNLRESGGLTWIAMYRPVTPVELRTVWREDDTRAYEFRHTLQFGGGARSGGLGAAPGSRPSARVAAVRFAGEAGPDEDRLRSVTRLRPGDRFDFFAWQRDRDALGAFLHARDYLEAKVGAEREAAGSAGGSQENDLLLTYTIERGPLTTVRVEGFALPTGVRDRLRDAWSRAVFDGFLLDDVREIVGRYLVEEGYLQAVIGAEIARSDAAAKQVVVSIQPGTRVTGKTIDFAGNEMISTERLLAALDPMDIRRAAWIDPDAVAAGLERFYRSAGFLAAAVSIGAPVVEGVRARLPVTIDEGPEFMLTRLVISGAGALDEATVRAMAALPEGGSYSAAAAEAARMRVEREYRRRGFNSVQTRAAATVDRSSAGVTVALAIVEGPQQVVADVAVTGAETTHPGVVTDNLALETGDPVDLAAWAQARRRLYDTNVFRSVELDVEAMDEPSAAPGDEQRVRARVTLEEWPRYRVRYGLQLNDEPSPLAERGREFSPGFVGEIQDRNLLGRAATSGLAVQFQKDFRIARAFLSAPSFLGRPIRSSAFLTRSREYFNEGGTFSYIEDITGGSLEQRVQLPPLFDLAYSYRLEYKRLFDPDPDESDFFPLDDRKRIGRLVGTLLAERRDDPFDATRGWFHSSTIEYGPEFLGSELRFVKYLAQAYHFWAAGADERPTVLASAVRFGAGRGFGQDLIPSEKFQLGGVNSVRGYLEDSLGDPLGGNGMLLFNQEVRFPIFRWVRGVAFLDAGNVFREASDVSLDLDVGIGFGLRIRTPFALVRIDHGTALSLRPGERANHWYFSIGQMF